LKYRKAHATFHFQYDLIIQCDGTFKKEIVYREDSYRNQVKALAREEYRVFNYKGLAHETDGIFADMHA
jgi:hypothetical protein